MIEIAEQLNAIQRNVSRGPIEGGEGVSVLLTREYDAAIDDVWEAMTDPDRIRRWFFPVSGDLRPAGKFQLEGNAGGDILTCEPPRLLRLTFGGPASRVELRLSPGGDERTRLELEHTVPIEMAQSGAGALYVGPGWDSAFLALALYLRAEDPVAAANSPEARDFSLRSVHAWASVVEASGTAGPEDLAAATEVSLAQFAPATES